MLSSRTMETIRTGAAVVGAVAATASLASLGRSRGRLGGRTWSGSVFGFDGEIAHAVPAGGSPDFIGQGFDPETGAPSGPWKPGPWARGMLPSQSRRAIVASGVPTSTDAWGRPISTSPSRFPSWLLVALLAGGAVLLLGRLTK